MLDSDKSSEILGRIEEKSSHTQKSFGIGRGLTGSMSPESSGRTYAEQRASELASQVAGSWSGPDTAGPSEGSSQRKGKRVTFDETRYERPVTPWIDKDLEEITLLPNIERARRMEGSEAEIFRSIRDQRLDFEQHFKDIIVSYRNIAEVLDSDKISEYSGVDVKNIRELINNARKEIKRLNVPPQGINTLNDVHTRFTELNDSARDILRNLEGLHMLGSLVSQEANKVSSSESESSSDESESE